MIVLSCGGLKYALLARTTFYLHAFALPIVRLRLDFFGPTTDSFGTVTIVFIALLKRSKAVCPSSNVAGFMTA